MLTFFYKFVDIIKYIMKKLLFLFFVVLLSFSSQASHFIGGEITWECDKDPLSPNYGKYTFYMTIYQDCDGIDFSTTGYNIDVHNHPSLFSINLPYRFFSRYFSNWSSWICSLL